MSGYVSKILDNNVDSGIGVDWQLLSVDERDGKCPGTNEKVKDLTKIHKTAYLKLKHRKKTNHRLRGIRRQRQDRS